MVMRGEADEKAGPGFPQDEEGEEPDDGQHGEGDEGICPICVGERGQRDGP